MAHTLYTRHLVFSRISRIFLGISLAYFPAFGLSTESYSVYPCIQSECEKIQTRKNSVFVHFSRSVTYLKSYNNFYDNISIAKDLSSEEMFKFSDILEIQGQYECVTEKKCFGWKRND